MAGNWGLGVGVRRYIVWGLLVAGMATVALVNSPAARADSVSKVVTILYPGPPEGGTQVVAWDQGDSGDYVCVSYVGTEYGITGVLTDCAVAVVVVDDLLRSASVQGTVQLRATGETVVIDTTHTGLQPTTHRRPTFYVDPRPTTPQGTNTALCFTWGTYEYSLWLSRDVTTEGTATRASAALGTPSWADVHRYRSSNRQTIRNCG